MMDDLPCAMVGDNVMPHVPVLPFSTVSVNGNPAHGNPIIRSFMPCVIQRHTPFTSNLHV